MQKKNQYQLLCQMFSNMIKGTGLPAWSVFIAAVDFFHNNKNLISDIFFYKEH